MSTSLWAGTPGAECQQVRIDPQQIIRFMAAAAQGREFVLARKAEPANPSQEWCEERPSLDGQEEVPLKELQETLWKQFFADTTQWWDNRRSKRSSGQPDFRHKESKAPLWLNNPDKPVWVEFYLAMVDAGLRTTPEKGLTSVQVSEASAAIEHRLEGSDCRELCEHGVISDAVDALDQLIQRRCLVPKNLFYRVLKRCIQSKELALGRRIHALTIKTGYEGDAFLATHLICFYASHRRLEEAMAVFTKVPIPDAYNWAAIISAHASQGLAAEAAEALRIYRRMCESSTIKPDDRLYLAVLKACAASKDVIAGKGVHARITATSDKPSGCLQAGLFNMYMKCGCLEDARGLFDKLSDKSLVTWTAMIAGYAQQNMGKEALSLYCNMQQQGLSPDSVTYTCLLQACANVGVGALYLGKQLHAQIEKRGLDRDVVVGGSLVNMYAKCGGLAHARRLLEKLPGRNVVASTAMIAGYVQQGMGQDALALYRRMRQEGVTPDSVTYLCLLQACASVGVAGLHQGKQLHAEIEGRGLLKDAGVGGSLVNMYAKCGSLENACTLFKKLPVRNIVAWNAIIAGYTQQGLGQVALDFHCSMQQEGLVPDSVTYVRLLQACASVGACALTKGKQIHADIKERGLENDPVLGGSLVSMYAKCGSLQNAYKLFNKLSERNVVAWTAMIAGYAQQGLGREALNMYERMQNEGLSANSVTYVCLLQACANVGADALCDGKHLHAQIKQRGLEEDTVLSSSLLDMYVKCGCLEDAKELFDRLSAKSIVAWTAMIAGYAQQGMVHEALSLYSSMSEEGLNPDSVMYVCLLQACASAGALQEGQQLHAQIEKQGFGEDVDLGGSLVNMYAKCGSLEHARRVFDKLLDKNVLAWNSMIAAYAKQGKGQEAFSLYSKMRQDGLTPNSITYVSLLQGCASVGVGALSNGRRLHEQIEGIGLDACAVVGGSLVNMYAKCGSLEDARNLFDKLQDRNVAAWNAMIAGYAQQGMGSEALALHRSMRQEGLTPDSVTYVCLLQACAAVAGLRVGEHLHAEIEGRGMQADCLVGAALVNMYAKCGSMINAQGVFDSLSERSIEAWGALISGYAYQGDSQVVFKLLDRMTREGIHPDEITFLSVLTVCSHVGQVDKGRLYFKAMKTDYGINATMEHYVCMVDLLGRAGHLQEALQLVKDMTIQPNEVVWLTLLGACQKWKNLEIGQQAFQSAINVDENDAAAYVLMSNIYASRQMWEAANEMKAKRMKLGAWKEPGQSWWTDLGGVVHTFLVGHKRHPESEGIYCRMERLISEMKEGHVSLLASAVLDKPSRDKMLNEVCAHTDNLSIPCLIKIAEDAQLIT